MSVGTTALALLALGVPGLGATFAAFRPGQADPALRLALILPFGYAVWGLSAVLLALAEQLSKTSCFVLVAAVTVALWVFAFRGGLRAHARALRDGVRAEPVALGIGAVVLLLFAVVRWRYSPLVNFDWYGPWRYWTDGQDIAAAGRVPRETLQWGAVYSPTVNKVILNSFNGAMGYLLGSSPLPAMGALLYCASLSMAAGLWALGRELGMRRAAPLLPLVIMILVPNGIRFDLGVYTAENWGRAISFAALALGVRAIRGPDGLRFGALAGLLFGAAAATHMIPALVCLLFLGLYALVVALLEGGWRERLRVAGAVIGMVAVVALPPLLLAGSSVGFQGASSNDYQAFPAKLDPTASLEKGEVREKRARDHGFYVTPAQLLERYTGKAGFGETAVWAYGTTIAMFALAIVMLLLAPRELRPIGIAVWGMGAVLLVVASAFSYRYTTLVPADFGGSRLFDYGLFGTALVGVALVEWAAIAAGARRAWLDYAVVAAVFVGFLVLASPAWGPKSTSITNGHRAINVANWIRANVPCNARMLPDRVTLGTFNAATGRVSVLEGMGPYLRPSMLHPVLDEVLGANTFFHDPAANHAYVIKNRIGYVLLLKRGLRMGSMKTAIGAGVDDSKFEKVPWLQQVAKKKIFSAYRVVPSIGLYPNVDVPDPTDYPWYECGRGQLDS